MTPLAVMVVHVRELEPMPGSQPDRSRSESGTIRLRVLACLLILAALAGGAQFVVQQRNVDRIRYRGVEAVVGYRSPRGLTLGGNYTHLEGERFGQSAVPLEDTFGDKLNLYVRYQPAGGRTWLEVRLRHQGEEETRVDPGEPLPPVGATLPSFTVYTLAGGLTVYEQGPQRHTLVVLIDNLTDELYAEFSNASFFRPQPERSFTASYRVRF